MFETRCYAFGKTATDFLLLIVLASLLVLPFTAIAKTALIETPLGDIEIELLEADAPNTVANFLNYLENGRYDKTFIHRSVPGFVIQGGGFTYIDDVVRSVETYPAIENEFKVSNTRGTVAMAKLGGQPDSATSQWFINIDDNTGLDTNNGGFTVFARVIGDGMEVADAINQLQRVNAGGSFGELPVIDFSGTTILEQHLVMTAVSTDSFVMNSGLNDAWYNPNTDGQGFFITVFPELGYVSLAWFTYDTELPPQDASASLGDPGHRWLTALGTYDGDSSVMNIEITSGGLFNAAAEIKRTDPAGSDGTITLTFSDCSSGLIEYDISSIDQQGSVPIQRVANDNVSLCEALSGE
jgi:cyclophilin family peptidyl-prolyl cis-trans isomerase